MIYEFLENSTINRLFTVDKNCLLLYDEKAKLNERHGSSFNSSSTNQKTHLESSLSCSSISPLSYPSSRRRICFLRRFLYAHIHVYLYHSQWPSQLSDEWRAEAYHFAISLSAISERQVCRRRVISLPRLESLNTMAIPARDDEISRSTATTALMYVIEPSDLYIWGTNKIRERIW